MPVARGWVASGDDTVANHDVPHITQRIPNSSSVHLTHHCLGALARLKEAGAVHVAKAEWGRPAPPHPPDCCGFCGCYCCYCWCCWCCSCGCCCWPRGVDAQLLLPWPLLHHPQDDQVEGAGGGERGPIPQVQAVHDAGQQVRRTVSQAEARRAERASTTAARSGAGHRVVSWRPAVVGGADDGG
jgi:hypothetical protein